MDACNLQVEIHCRIPGWVSDPHNANYRTNIYRLYLNNDLLTERSWIWNQEKVFINEDIWAFLDKNVEHTLELRPVLKNPAQAKFKFENFRIIGQYNSQAANDNQIKFILK